MNKILHIFILLAALVALPGCGNDDNKEPDYASLLGTWQSIGTTNDAQGSPLSITILIQFNKNSTFTEVDIISPATGGIIKPGEGEQQSGSSTQTKVTVSRGTWVGIGGQIYLEGGGVATATSTHVALSDNTLTIIADDGSHIFSPVPETTIKKYL